MNAPDLNKNGRFDFQDFSKLFDHYFEHGLPYGEPVLPAEWEFISADDETQLAIVTGTAKPAAAEPAEGAAADTETPPSSRHRENRIKMEKLQLKLAQDEERKKKEAEAKKDQAPERDELADIDPRYRDLPELFEKRMLEKRKRQDGSSSSATLSYRTGADTKKGADDDDYDDDDDRY
jgi:hypothetical protein